MAEFEDGHANGIGVLYDKNQKELSKGVWKDGAVSSALPPDQEGKLKTIEQTARQYNARSFDENYKIALIPTSNIFAEDGIKPKEPSPSNALKKDADKPSKKADKKAEEKPKDAKSQAKSPEKMDPEEVLKKTKKSKDKSASPSKEPTKKKIKKKELSDGED